MIEIIRTMPEWIVNFIGGCGAAAFGICALPQVLKAWHTKSTKDISITYIGFSIAGNVISGTYMLIDNIRKDAIMWPQYFNYSCALILIFILLYLKIKYDKR